MNIICVTNRSLIEKENFYSQIKKICLSGPQKIILREKELLEYEYRKIAEKCLNICKDSNVELAVNKFINVAESLNIKNIHLSFSNFIDNYNKLSSFDCVGVSVHSLEEAVKAEKLGVQYIIAGHIFMTDCKKGIPPRGIKFFREICENVDLPVYAIGGINTENALNLKKSGAYGVCLMSSLMKAEKPDDIINKIKSL